jgi:hypothetical protein
LEAKDSLADLSLKSAGSSLASHGVTVLEYDVQSLQ